MAKTSFEAPSARRPEFAGVHSLDLFSLNVPDLAKAREFYEAFGLNITETSTGLELRASGSHVWGLIQEGRKKAIGHVRFGAYREDLPIYLQRLKAAGIPLIDPLPGIETGGIWFCDPHGQLIEIVVAEKSMPDLKSQVNLESVSPGQRGAQLRDQVSQIRPTRMAHALFFTPDVAASVKFYCDILGLRLSDNAGPVAFLHGVHGSDHHLIAFAQSDSGIGYHHSAWEVASIEEIGLGAMQMAHGGYARGWGLGRHVLGSNYFHYVRDPWGSYAEYSFDIDYIPSSMNWQASYPTPENGFYLWGPTTPEDFAHNYEHE